MTAEEFEARIVAWARGCDDVEALIQIGSRVGAGMTVDAWSDWDFYLITRAPDRLRALDWLGHIAPLWCAHVERTPRGVHKVSAVFAGAREADFVLLAAWQMKLVFWAMQYPQRADLMPRRLQRGILETRAFLRASGTRVLVGGAAWQRRLEALAAPWPERAMTAGELAGQAEAFWQKAVWISKRIARPESRAAMHGLHRLVIEQVYVLLAEEARLAGRPARAEARKAEQWLDARRREQTALATSPDQVVLARALLAEMDLFEEVARSVAGGHGFALPDHAAVAAWVRHELQQLLP